jgi:fumarate hydratase class II
MTTRTETDTFGPIPVESDKYWGAQAQRSLQNFKIGEEKMSAPQRKPIWSWASLNLTLATRS